MSGQRPSSINVYSVVYIFCFILKLKKNNSVKATESQRENWQLPEGQTDDKYYEEAIYNHLSPLLTYWHFVYDGTPVNTVMLFY